MVPRGKLSPGTCDLVIAGVTPELSVTVGSVHVTIIDVVPMATLKLSGSGQPLTVGGVVSWPSTVDIIHVLISKLLKDTIVCSFVCFINSL